MTNAFDTTEMRDLRKRLNNRNNHMNTTAPSTSPVIRPPSMRRDGHGPMQRPFVPHTVHLREFNMVDGRKILLDRRAVAFVCQRKEEPEKHSIVAFKSGVAGIPIDATYGDLVKWWRTTP